MHEDKDLMDELIRMCDIIKPKTSIEVGGFDSAFSCEMMFKDYCDEIYSYEANPYVYEHFKEFIPPDVNFINIAISNYNGTISFGIEHFEDPIQGHLSTKKRNNQHLPEENFINVSCSTLDFLHKQESIVLWIDCEGANREVLLGAEHVLENTELILIETEHFPFWEDQWLHQDVVDFLVARDFCLHTRVPYGELQSNCIFVKNKHMGKI